MLKSLSAVNGPVSWRQTGWMAMVVSAWLTVSTAFYLNNLRWSTLDGHQNKQFTIEVTGIRVRSRFISTHLYGYLAQVTGDYISEQSYRSFFPEWFSGISKSSMNYQLMSCMVLIVMKSGWKKIQFLVRPWREMSLFCNPSLFIY